MTVKIKGTLTQPNYSLAPIIKVRVKSLIKVMNTDLTEKMDSKSFESIQSVNEVGELIVNIIELLKDATIDSDLDMFVDEIFEVAVNNDVYDLMIKLRSIILIMSKSPENNYKLIFYAVINLIIRAYDYGTAVGIDRETKEVVFDNTELNLIDREMLLLVECNSRQMLDSELDFVNELKSYIQSNKMESFNNFANNLTLTADFDVFRMLFEAPNTLAEVVVDMIMRDIKPNQPVTGKFYSCTNMQSYHSDVVGYSQEPMNWASKELLMQVVFASSLENIKVPKEGVKLLLPPNSDGIFSVTINKNEYNGLDVLTIDTQTMEDISRFNWFALDNVSTFYTQTHYNLDSVITAVVLYYLGVVKEEMLDIPNQYLMEPTDVQDMISSTMHSILNSYKRLSNLAFRHN